MKKTILFDLDGTLIDSTEAILECFHYAFSEQNFKFFGTNEDIKNEIGYPLDIMFYNLGVDKNKVWDFVDSYKKEYSKISIKKTFLLSNAKKSIDLASTFATLAIVTTKTTSYSIKMLEDFGIFEYFDTIIGRQEVKNPKPDPEPVEKALKNLNINPSLDVYMIGDTKLDIIAANKANINSVGVLCGYGKREDLSLYTNNIVADSLEAVESIKKNYF
ncbi:MAG: HAD family hydrolase [Campylobacterota bacterium]|nr:HAD family hydrolase [Campylobacterota bacterium]